MAVRDVRRPHCHRMSHADADSQLRAILTHPLVSQHYATTNLKHVPLERVLTELREFGEVELTTATLVDRAASWRCQLALRAGFSDLAAEGETALLAALRCHMEVLSFIEKEHRAMQRDIGRTLRDS
jgi:hypothetical protein